MILSCHVRQLSWIKMEGNPPAFPKSAVISQLREVRTGTARSVPPVRLNQGAFLAFITVEYLDSIADTIYGWFPLLYGAAGCWGAKRSFSPTSYLGGPIHSSLSLRLVFRLSSLQTGCGLVGRRRPLAVGLPCTPIRRPGRSHSVPERVRHQASPALRN